MSFGGVDLAGWADRIGASRKKALAAAAVVVLEKIETALAPHHRTGNAEGSAAVAPVGAGLAVESVRYQKYIKGVPQGDALKSIAVEAYNTAVRAQIGSAS